MQLNPEQPNGVLLLRLWMRDMRIRPQLPAKGLKRYKTRAVNSHWSPEVNWHHYSVPHLSLGYFSPMWVRWRQTNLKQVLSFFLSRCSRWEKKKHLLRAGIEHGPSFSASNRLNHSSRASQVNLMSANLDATASITQSNNELAKISTFHCCAVSPFEKVVCLFAAQQKVS